MRFPTILTYIGLAAAIAPAHADFNIINDDPAPAATTDSGAAPPGVRDPAAATSPTPSRSPAAPKRTRKVSGAPIARGFGDKVPLSFAARQIVPTPIKVDFARGADQSALVDWKGGREWARVLREAIRPLGLHLTLRRTTATIGP